MASCSLSQAGVVFSDVQTVTGASGASVAAEVLDHYEEGAWTPTYSATGCTFSYGGANYGKYTRIGNLCHCNGYLDTNSSVSGTTGNAVDIHGIPFTPWSPGGLGYQPLALSFFIHINFQNVDGAGISMHYLTGSPYIRPYHIQDAASPGNVTAAQMAGTADSRIAFQGPYMIG